MIEEIFQQIVRKFNEKAKCDEKIRGELAGIERRIQVELDNERTYIGMLRDCALTDFSPGKFEKPDLRIICSEKVLLQLWNKEIGPWKAIVTGKLKIVGSIEDKMRLRNLLGD
jgi:putative sterol carrier protein